MTGLISALLGPFGALTGAGICVIIAAALIIPVEISARRKSRP